MKRCVNVFFFQAEDGIRDLYVTGVQTCALPICGLGGGTRGGWAAGGQQQRGWDGAPVGGPQRAAPGHRSEERRVGKEGRSRWSIEHKKEKKRTALSGRRLKINDLVVVEQYESQT